MLLQLHTYRLLFFCFYYFSLMVTKINGLIFFRFLFFVYVGVFCFVFCFLFFVFCFCFFWIGKRGKMKGFEYFVLVSHYILDDIYFHWVCFLGSVLVLVLVLGVNIIITIPSCYSLSFVLFSFYWFRNFVVPLLIFIGVDLGRWEVVCGSRYIYHSMIYKYMGNKLGQGGIYIHYYYYIKGCIVYNDF
jgi:hypothetical protein